MISRMTWSRPARAGVRTALAALLASASLAAHQAKAPAGDLAEMTGSV
jgi:hypothetical protein